MLDLGAALPMSAGQVCAIVCCRSAGADPDAAVNPRWVITNTPGLTFFMPDSLTTTSKVGAYKRESTSYTSRYRAAVAEHQWRTRNWLFSRAK